ncbi:MAG: T9SS type A sorting domain-containing protein [Chitinophagales bacterium]
MTAEAGSGGNAALYKLTTDAVLGIADQQKSDIQVYPNPSSNLINIEGDDLIKVLIYDNNGNLQFISKEHEIDISSLASGIYYFMIHTIGSEEAIVRQIVVD